MEGSTQLTFTSREDNVFMAKLAEQAERFEEMVKYMKAVAEQSVELTVEERNLLSVAYKNVIGSRRASWRIINTIDAKDKDTKVFRGDKIKAYRTVIENELTKICNEILSLLDDHLIPHSIKSESKVFHFKMKGDYYRYLAEFQNPVERDAAAKNSNDAYATATVIAEKELAATHPIRLGLALNYSVFFYEILNKRFDAIRLAKQAFDEAIAVLDSLSEESYKDSTLILQLLRDNLTLWSSDNESKDDPKLEDTEEELDEERDD